MPRSIWIAGERVESKDWHDRLGQKAIRVAYSSLYRWNRNWLDCTGDVINSGYVFLLESDEMLEFESDWRAAGGIVRYGFRNFNKFYKNHKKVAVSINDTLTADGFTLEQVLSNSEDMESNLFASDTKLDLMGLIGQTGSEELVTITHLLLNGLSPVEIAEAMKTNTLNVMRLHRAVTDLAIKHNIGSEAPKLKLKSSVAPIRISHQEKRKPASGKIAKPSKSSKSKPKTTNRFQRVQQKRVRILTTKKGGTYRGVTYFEGQSLTMEWSEANRLITQGVAIEVDMDYPAHSAQKKITHNI